MRKRLESLWRRIRTRKPGEPREVLPFVHHEEYLATWCMLLADSGPARSENEKRRIRATAEARTRESLACRIDLPLEKALQRYGLDELDRMILLVLIRQYRQSGYLNGVRFENLQAALGIESEADRRQLYERMEIAGALRARALIALETIGSFSNNRYILSPRYAAEVIEGREDPSYAPMPALESSLRGLDRVLSSFLIRSPAAAESSDPASQPVHIPWGPSPSGPGWTRYRSMQLAVLEYMSAMSSSAKNEAGQEFASGGYTDAEKLVLGLLLTLDPETPGEKPAVSGRILMDLADPLFGPGETIQTVLGDCCRLKTRGILQAAPGHDSLEGRLYSLTAEAEKRFLAWKTQGTDEFNPGFDPEDNLGARAMEPRVSLEQVILPSVTRQRVEDALASVRHASTVFGEWGFGEHEQRRPAATLLFWGPPGTGKTLAAEAIARELGKKLWVSSPDRILSKWVGDSEKVLVELFARAQKSGALLLFDEVDTYLRRRNETSRTWEVHMVNQLLVSLETHEGIAILTTNQPDVLDEALERRLLAKVEFPLPGEAERRVLWKVLQPPRAPMGPDVSFEELARRHAMTGSDIKTAWLRAAVSAAQRAGEERVIQQSDLRAAVTVWLQQKKRSASPGFAVERDVC